MDKKTEKKQIKALEQSFGKSANLSRVSDCTLGGVYIKDAWCEDNVWHIGTPPN